MICYYKILKESRLILLIIIMVILSACDFSDKTLNTASADSAVAASAKDIRDWVSLFDSKTFTGWHTYGQDSVSKAWKVEDSVIHLNSLLKNGWQTAGGGDLVTDEEYSNFDLKLEWKISEAGNSGIFFYVHEDTTKFKNPNQSGLEMQINDDANNKNGTTEKQRNGDLVGLASSSPAKEVKPAGQWNLSEIRSDRGKLYFFINGQLILSTTLWDDSWENLINNSKFKTIKAYGTYKKGRIVLQDHGADVWFRNIMIKKL